MGRAKEIGGGEGEEEESRGEGTEAKGSTMTTKRGKPSKREAAIRVRESKGEKKKGDS